MSILLTQSYVLYAQAEPDVPPARFTRIGYQSIARRGTVTASGNNDDEGFIDAPRSDLTYEWWRADALPAWWAVDAGEAVTVDYAGVAVHNLSTVSASVKVQHSDDGSAWTDVPGAETIPGTDAPLMILFEPITARYWRLRFAGSGDAPRVGVIYIGKVLAMQRPVKWRDHSPGTLSRRTTVRGSQSDGGQRLGTSVVRQGYQADYDVSNMTETWYRDQFDPFVQHARRIGYFISWRPVERPGEVLFGWTDDDIEPFNEVGGKVDRRMGVQWGMRAHGGYEVDRTPWDYLE